MQEFMLPVQVRWADIDANFHLRHSVYYDWGATCRVEFLQKHGLNLALMQQLQIGPILLREECIFKREIRIGDEVALNMELVSCRRDFSRWSIRHTFYKNKETVSAVLTIDGAWIDTAKRKMAVPPEAGIRVFSAMPKAEDFSWTD